jgi:hypothetical protein
MEETFTLEEVGNAVWKIKNADGKYFTRIYD